MSLPSTPRPRQHDSHPKQGLPSEPQMEMGRSPDSEHAPARPHGMPLCIEFALLPGRRIDDFALIQHDPRIDALGETQCLAVGVRVPYKKRVFVRRVRSSSSSVTVTGPLDRKDVQSPASEVLEREGATAQRGERVHRKRKTAVLSAHVSDE